MQHSWPGNVRELRNLAERITYMTQGDHVEMQDLGDSPAILGEPAEPAKRVSGLLHVEAEAVSAGGSYFAREAVIVLNRREARPYRFRLWRRGARVLVPALEEAR